MRGFHNNSGQTDVDDCHYSAIQNITQRVEQGASFGERTLALPIKKLHPAFSPLGSHFDQSATPIQAVVGPIGSFS